KTIELIDEIHDMTGAAIIIIEHRIEDVLHRPVDRVVLMNDGRILTDSCPNELLSSEILRDNGIREPLYVTALKYAGVDVNTEMKPGMIETLCLNNSDKDKVRTWFKSIPLDKKEDNRPVILEAKNIEFAYANGHKALSDISLSIKKGEMMSIVGKNGAGKSTFSKVVCGFENQTSGTLLLESSDMENLSIKERAQHIGYVMQNPNQMITKSMIFDEVGLGLVMRGNVSKEDIDKRVDDTLKICGLHPFKTWPISALSYGQKKRVTIASILSMNPEIVILDEPTAGQDFRHYTDIMEFLKKLNQQGVTIVLITHDMHLMLEYSERAVVFTDGKKVADAPCEQILTDDDLANKASLKKTSLSDLALMCGLDQTQFVRAFIEYDRKVRA
ncbi:MAG: DUF3744 domain-containing protein, partial [Sphaerochaetaceae bacterium]|nr:DUF3744 domain-containing protein [Sphaerochaetaceae bacterium]